MAVHMVKGCYIGQETLSKVINQNAVRQQLWGVELTCPAQEGDVIRGDQALQHIRLCCCLQWIRSFLPVFRVTKAVQLPGWLLAAQMSRRTLEFLPVWHSAPMEVTLAWVIYAVGARATRYSFRVGRYGY
jgi:hypothetical protein